MGKSAQNLLCGILLSLSAGWAFAESPPGYPSKPLLARFEPDSSWESLSPEESGLQGFWRHRSAPGRVITLQKISSPGVDLGKIPLRQLSSELEAARASIQEPLGIRDWRITRFSRTRLKHVNGWLLELEGSYQMEGGKAARFLERQYVMGFSAYQIQAIWHAEDGGLGEDGTRKLLDGLRLEAP